MKKLLSLGGLALAVILFVGFNIVCNALFTSTRVDLTSNKLYTLSDGTKSVLSKLNEPVKLKFYFSKKLGSDAGPLLGYAERVRELLEEFVAHSHGKVTLEVFDPEPFSEEEDRAVGYGLQGVPLPTGEKLYFGLAGTGMTDQEEVIPFFQQSKEESLEYDITKLVFNLSSPKKKVVGMITKLPVEADPMERMRNPRAQPPEDWFILEQIRSQFELRTISDGVGKIEDGIDVLLVVHPQQLAQETLYAIDQFVLAGGKAVVFADPYCEVQKVQEDPKNPLQSMMEDRSSTLGPLFDAWGVEMKADEIAGDRDTALRVNYNNQPVEYLIWLGLRADKGDFSTSDFTTSQLETVNIASAGILKKKDGSTIEFSPLMETTKDSQRIQKSMIQFGGDPPKLLQGFKSGDEKLVLAARLSGPVKTAFPDGKPKAADPAGEPKPEDKPGESLKESKGPINVIVVADADMLADRFWTRVQNFLGIQKVAVPTADNCNFLMNALDNLSGSNDLISLRSRGKYQRPFDKVAAIRKEAETKFQLREKELEDKLRDTETKITEMQRGKDGGAGLILTDESRAELEKFRDEQVKTRKELRRVKHDLMVDVESLGTTIKWVNIGIVPLALTAFALVFLGMQSSGRKKG